MKFVGLMPFNNYQAEIVFGVAEGEDVFFDGVEDFAGGEVSDFVEFLFEVMGCI